MTSDWLRERPMENGKSTAPSSTVLDPEAMRTTISKSAAGDRVDTIGVEGVAGAAAVVAAGVEADASRAALSVMRG